MRPGARICGGALAAMSVALVTGAAASASRAPVAASSRTFALPAGRATRTFALHERQGVVLLNRVTVARGARVVVVATIPSLAGVRVASWLLRHDPSLSCRVVGADESCTQAEEWCPMPAATWHVRLVKLGGPAGLVRFDFVLAPPP